MSVEHERDMFGNRTPGNLSSSEAQTAGALPTDSPDDIQWKVNRHRVLHARPGGASAPGSARAMINAFVVLGIAFLLVIAAAFTQPWWKQLASPSGAWERFQASRSVDERRDEFSDFSSLDEWPQAVRAGLAGRERLTPAELVARLPAQGAPTERLRAELGAAMWFAISAAGSEAGATYREFQASTVAKGADIQFLALNFLQKECKAGVEVACLDLAKALACAVFRPEYTRADRELATGAALAQLPRSGPLAASPAVIALKDRLAAYDARAAR